MKKLYTVLAISFIVFIVFIAIDTAFQSIKHDKYTIFAKYQFRNIEEHEDLRYYFIVRKNNKYKIVYVQDTIYTKKKINDTLTLTIKIGYLSNKQLNKSTYQ